MARSMIFTANLEFHFWGDALQYACYILNGNSSRSNTGRKSPLEALAQKPQDLSRVVVFGSSCTVQVESRGAWSKRAKQGRILGMSGETKGYRIYIPEDRVDNLIVLANKMISG
jgi:hypothetical protein